jgi:hypothetical protein
MESQPRGNPLNALHVVPAGDTVDHPTSLDCPCHPTEVPVDHPDGTTGVIHVHHAADGRENLERKRDASVSTTATERTTP